MKTSLLTLQNYLKSVERFFKPFGNFIQKKESIVTEENPEKRREEFKKNYCESGSQNPYSKSNIFEKLFISWVNPIIEIGQKNTFDENMLFKMPEGHDVKTSCEEFDSNWEKTLRENQDKIKDSRYIETDKKPNLLLKCFLNMYAYPIIIACVLTAIVSSIRVAQAWLMNFF